VSIATAAVVKAASELRAKQAELTATPACNTAVGWKSVPGGIPPAGPRGTPTGSSSSQGSNQTLKDINARIKTLDDRITPPALAAGGNNEVERAIPKNQFETIQANLCVDATGQFDKDTREAIRQAKIGARQSRQAIPGALPFDNIDSEIKSRTEAQKFLDARNCSKDSTGAERVYLTTFEKFRFPDPAAIKDLQRSLKACVSTLQESDSFDKPTRNAIKAVKGNAVRAGAAPFGDPNSNKLNDKSYDYINRACVPTVPLR
jgi:hypothetical protein